MKRYHFTGKERDGETGLYYFGVRYYASWLGRWISADLGGFVDGLNLYRYTRNNPVNNVDREGYFTDPVSDAFLTYSIVKGISQGGLRALTYGNKPWSHKNFWDPKSSYRSLYRQYGTKWAGKGEHIHHWFLHQNQFLGKMFPNAIKHQMWNLKLIKGRTINGTFHNSAAMHRAIHGRSKTLELSTLQRYYYGTPRYPLYLGTSIGGRLPNGRR